jgi:hypothetical protein
VSPAVDNVSLIKARDSVRFGLVEVVERIGAKSVPDRGREEGVMAGVGVTTMAHGKRSVAAAELARLPVMTFRSLEKR